MFSTLKDGLRNWVELLIHESFKLKTEEGKECTLCLNELYDWVESCLNVTLFFKATTDLFGETCQVKRDKHIPIVATKKLLLNKEACKKGCFDVILTRAGYLVIREKDIGVCVLHSV